MMMDVCDEEDHKNAETLERPLRKRRHRDSNDDSKIQNNYNVTSLQVLERSQNPNFEELARQYQKFKFAWIATKSLQKERGKASFSSCVTQEFTIELTRALLSSHFRLKLLYLDEDHLCPPIPNRFFYLHWIHTHLMGIKWVGVKYVRNNKGEGPRLEYNNTPSELGNVDGLDIGSGASCIYSMLAARFFRSTMITSEIDSKSVSLANANVKANHLSNMVTVLQVPPTHSQQQQQQHNNSAIGGPLQRAVEIYFQQQQQNFSPLKSRLVLDFVMTNPPFYDPASTDISTARIGDGRQRSNMTVSEAYYPVGEVGFVTEMIEDSLRISNNEIQATTTTTEPYFSAAWHSSMLGKKTSLIKLKKLLIHLLGPAHVESTEYGPGHYTRWFLAWTLKQPPVNASGAICPHNDKDHFQVNYGVPIGTRDVAVREVVDRIIIFCESSPGGWDLRATINNTIISSTGHNEEFVAIVRIQENMPPVVANFVDETESKVEIPESILRVLRGRDNSRFLPDEGHFLIEAKILVGYNNSNSENRQIVDVHLSCYRHSARGAKAIEKIRNSLDKEVCRTSRKWRRIRERQQWEK